LELVAHQLEISGKLFVTTGQTFTGKENSRGGIIAFGLPEGE
jgi:hypothetical protein